MLTTAVDTNVSVVAIGVAITSIPVHTLHSRASNAHVASQV